MNPIEIRSLDLVVIGVYLIGMLCVGLWFARRNQSTKEYFVGGRAFPGWAIIVDAWNVDQFGDLSFLCGRGIRARLVTTGLEPDAAAGRRSGAQPLISQTITISKIL